VGLAGVAASYRHAELAAICGGEEALARAQTEEGGSVSKQA